MDSRGARGADTEEIDGLTAVEEAEGQADGGGGRREGSRWSVAVESLERQDR